MRTVPGLRLIGTASHKASVISFLLDKIHAHDVGTILNDKGIAVRTGKLCAEPAMQRFGVSAVVRASFGLYNTQHEIDRLVTALHDTNQLFRKS
jgi:cysteine desulfurase/selenocysteine lyase